MKHAVILNWVFAIAVVPAVVGAYDLESAYRSRGGYDYHKAASSRDGVYDINAARAERGAFEGVKPGTADVATNALPAVSESSLDWYRAAAARGSAEAQFCLGAIYEEGRLVPQDLSQAVAWYRQAAAQGNADAWIALAGLHDIGKGVPAIPPRPTPPGARPPNSAMSPPSTCMPSAATSARPPISSRPRCGIAVPR